jgi:hypothetical protein
MRNRATGYLAISKWTGMVVRLDPIKDVAVTAFLGTNLSRIPIGSNRNRPENARRISV